MKVDNRWSAGGLDARVPETAKAAYGARWIDHDTWVDVVPDRQGFAYDNETGLAARQQLIEHLITYNAQDRAITIGYETEEPIVLDENGFSLWMRRAGGYVYVAAWIQ